MTTRVPRQPPLEGWLPALAGLTAAVNRDVSLQELLNQVAKTACDLMGYDFCAVTLPDGARSVLLIKGSHGLSEEYVQDVNATHPIVLAPGPQASPSSQAFMTGKPRQVVDALNSPIFVPWGGVAREQGFVSMIAMPLSAGETRLGTLNCYTKTRHEADRAETELLAMLADQAANAIRTAQLRQAQVETIHHLNEANETLTRQHDLQRQSSQIHDRFTALTLGGGGIPAVTSALATLTGRSVAVRDVYGELLHSAEVTDNPLPEPLADERWAEGEHPSLTQEEPQRLGLVNIMDSVVVRLPVVLQEEVVAWIWTSASTDGVSEIDRRAIEHAGTVLALELLRSRAVAETTWRGSGEILATLLSAEANLSPALMERSIRLGHDLKAPHALIVLRTPAGQDGPPPHRIAAAFSRWGERGGPRPLVGRREGYLVVLWPDVERVGPTGLRAVSEQIRRTLAGHPAPRQPLVTAVVGPVEGLEDYPGAYTTAVGAVELAAQDGTTDKTVILDDLGVAGLLLQVPDSPALTRFLRATLGPLQAYDARHGTELVQTLRCLAACDLNATRASEALYIHKNTVVQRRRRIEELLGAGLGSTEALTNIMIGLRLLEVAQARHR